MNAEVSVAKSTSESRTGSTDQRRESAVPLLLAVVGSVAGTLVSSVFSSSQELALLGATLGAAIPPFVAVAGPYTNLRLGVGVLIAVGALGITYGGFTVGDKVTGQEATTFPLPGSPAKETKGTGPAPAQPSPTVGGSPTAGFTCEGELCISWSPTHLHCSSDPCTPDVTVRSEGSKTLKVTGLKFTGAGAGRLDTEDKKGKCEDAWLEQEGTCTIRVRIEPGKTSRAQLRIQQNLAGPASIVDIDLDFSSTSSPSPDPETPSPTPDPTPQSPSPSPSPREGKSESQSPVGFDTLRAKR